MTENRTSRKSKKLTYLDSPNWPIRSLHSSKKAKRADVLIKKIKIKRGTGSWGIKSKMKKRVRESTVIFNTSKKISRDDGSVSGSCDSPTLKLYQTLSYCHVIVPLTSNSIKLSISNPQTLSYSLFYFIFSFLLNYTIIFSFLLNLHNSYFIFI